MNRGQKQREIDTRIENKLRKLDNAQREFMVALPRVRKSLRRAHRKLRKFDLEQKRMALKSALTTAKLYAAELSRGTYARAA